MENMSPTPVAYESSSAPVGQLKTNRSLLKFILLSIVTLGIYSIVFFTGIANDINVVASRYDGKRTMHFCLLCFIIAPITFGIGGLVWCHKFSARVGNELARRNLPYSFGAMDFWLWDILASLVIVGPFIYMHKLITSVNQIAEHYNIHG